MIIDYSVVVTFSLVPDGADMDSTSGLDFEKDDIAGCSKGNNQLTGEGTIICFAAAKRAHCQELTPLAYRFNRLRWDIKITSRTVQFTFKGEIKQSFEILFGLAAENDLVRHCRCCLWRSLAAATFASSLAITVSAGIQSPSASERAIAARPRRTNSDWSRRRVTSVLTAFSTSAAMVSPSPSDCSISWRKADSIRIGGIVAVFMFELYRVCDTVSTCFFLSLHASYEVVIKGTNQ